MEKNPSIKNFTNTYLYSKSDRYEEVIIKNIMKADRININDEAFADLLSQIKRRQVTSILSKVLKSENIILTHSLTPLPKSLKVLCVKDIKVDNELRVFIDTSSVLKKLDNGEWGSNNIDTLISYILSAMVNFIYYKQNQKIRLNSALTKHGSIAFSSLFSNIINYLYKINLLEAKRDKCTFLSAMYYNVNLLSNDMNSQSVISQCKNISGLSDREIEIIKMELEEDDFLNIRTFIECISRILKLDKLTVDVFVERWIFTYGTGTHFGLEFLPSFSTILTDAYVGDYINNQKTIEKIVGKDMVDFTKTIFRIGESVVG